MSLNKAAKKKPKMIYIGIKEFEREMGQKVENWLRWGRRRDWLPATFSSMLASQYISRRRDQPTGMKKLLDPVNELDACRMEEIITSLPERHRTAFLLYFTGRAAVSQKIRRVRRPDDCAKLMAIGKWQYYNLLRQASQGVLTAWEQG